MTEQDAATLPALRRAERRPERILYVARAGLGALPSGFGTILVFMAPQAFALVFFFWAIWWPYPSTTRGLAWAVLVSVAIVASALTVAGLLIRRNPGFLAAVARAPFISITVTDRRMLWTVPWARQPLIEIGRSRILRGVAGGRDRHGRGNAAVELVPGDPAADIDGHIHFDRLPDVDGFVRAVGAGR